MDQKPDLLTRVGRFAVLITGAAGLIWFLYRIRLAIFLLIGSAWLAYALDPVAELLSARKPRLRPLGIALAYIAVFAAFGLVIGIALGPAVRDARGLAASLPAYAQRLQEWQTHASTSYLERLPPGFRPVIDEVVREASSRLQALGVNLAQRSVALVVSTTALLAAGALMLIMSIMLLADKEYFKQGVFLLIPTAYQTDAATLLDEIDDALSAFVRGQLITAAAVGGTLMLGMKILNVQYAVLLGLFAGITQLVPDVGAVVGLVAAVTLTAFQGLWQAVRALILFLVVYQLAARVMGPWVMSRTVRIHPLVVILATVAGAVLGGVWGALLAVPVTAVLKVIVAFAYQRLAARYRLGPVRGTG